MTAPTGNPRGRPPITAPRTDEFYQAVEDLAANGWSLVGIARCWVVSHEIFRRWLDADPELQLAFDCGRERERHALHNMLFVKATQRGDSAAAMFLLKARHSYREGDQSDLANTVSITFQLPGAMSVDDFKVIGHGSTQRDGPDDRNVAVPSKSLIRS